MYDCHSHINSRLLYSKVIFVSQKTLISRWVIAFIFLYWDIYLYLVSFQMLGPSFLYHFLEHSSFEKEQLSVSGFQPFTYMSGTQDIFTAMYIEYYRGKFVFTMPRVNILLFLSISEVIQLQHSKTFTQRSFLCPKSRLGMKSREEG